VENGVKLRPDDGNDKSAYPPFKNRVSVLTAEDILAVWINVKSTASIDQMLQPSATPQNTQSGSVILRSGSRRHILVNPRGERTNSGEYYKQKTSNELPFGGFDFTQSPFREGNTEFIKMRNGEERAVRRYSPVDNEYKLTVLGKSFYSRLKRNYVVQIPVLVKGRRKDGSYYNIKSTLPISKMGVDRIQMRLNLTAQQRTQKIKEIVSAKLNLDEPIYEVSQEAWSYDQSSSGSWIINEETVGIHPDTRESVIALDRRVAQRLTRFPRYPSQKAYSQRPFKRAAICVASHASSPAS